VKERGRALCSWQKDSLHHSEISGGNWVSKGGRGKGKLKSNNILPSDQTCRTGVKTQKGGEKKIGRLKVKENQGREVNNLETVSNSVRSQPGREKKQRVEGGRGKV